MKADKSKQLFGHGCWLPAVEVELVHWNPSWGLGGEEVLFLKDFLGDFLEVFWLDASTSHDPVKLEPDPAPPECQSNPKAVQYNS